jgi:hypothetical protein
MQSVSLSAESKKVMKTIKNPGYTDVNKKILNIGGAYYHHIEKGDTIWGTLIVKNKVDPNHYEYYLKELLKLNPKIKDPNLIYAGDDLLVPFIPEEHKKEWVPPKKAKKKKPAEKVVAKVVKTPKPAAKPVPKKEPSKKAAPPPKKAEVTPKEATKDPLRTRTIEIRPPEPEVKKVPPPVKKAEVKPPAKKADKPPPVKAQVKPEPPKKAEVKPAAKPKPTKEPLKKEALAPEVLTIAKGGDAGVKGIKTGMSKSTGTVVIGNALVEAIKTFSDKVVTKGTLYLPLKGKKPLKLDNSAFPVVFSGEKKIILDYDDKIKKEDEDNVKGRFEYYDFVNVNKKDSDKVVFGKVLKASGFYSVKENKEVKVGKNIKLIVRYDWLIEKDRDSFLNSDVKLVKVKVSEDDKVPAYIKKYLEKTGFFIIEVKVAGKAKQQKTKMQKGTITSFGSPKETKTAVRKLLTLLGVKFREKAALKASEDAKPFLRADFYFEHDSKPVVLNLRKGTKEEVDIAKEYEIGLVSLGSKKRSENLKTVLNLLKKDFRYGTFRLLGNKGETPFLDVEVKGFLIGKNALKITSPTGNYYESLPLDDKNIFVTDHKFPGTLKRLVMDHGYKLVEK